jgi:plasmid stabilization system protein ParE
VRLEVLRRPKADSDYSQIVQWLTERNPAVARRFQLGFRKTCFSLGQQPELGSRYLLETGESIRKVRVGFFRKYWMFYSIEGNTIHVLRVIHSSQNMTLEVEN